ncbi:MAG: hypothetical protein GY946_17335, partial [bacterium]|nr:hypothetical protein [bacterium]
NNMPTHIERIEVGFAGSGAPKQDRLLGVLLPGSSFTIGLAEGVYDIDVWVWDQPFGYIQSYTEVVTSGNVQTIVATP